MFSLCAFRWSHLLILLLRFWGGSICIKSDTNLSCSLMSEPERTRNKKYRAFLCTLCLLEIVYLHLQGWGNYNNFLFISTSLPVISWLSYLMFFIQISSSLAAERTLSVKPYLLVLLHKIMLNFICCGVSADCEKALSHCCDVIRWLLLARNFCEGKLFILALPWPVSTNVLHFCPR